MHLKDDFRIACALLNKVHVTINDPTEAFEYVTIAKNRLSLENHLATFVESENVNRRANFQQVDSEHPHLTTFPRLTITDLKRLALGTYQLKQARSYFGEHVRQSGIYLVQVITAIYKAQCATALLQELDRHGVRDIRRRENILKDAIERHIEIRLRTEQTWPCEAIERTNRFNNGSLNAQSPWEDEWSFRPSTLSSADCSSYRGSGWVSRIQSSELLHFPSVLEPDSLYYYLKHSNTTASAYVKRHRPQRTTTYNKDAIPGLYKHLRKFLCHPERFSRDEYVDSIDDPGRRKAYRAAVTDLENGDGAVARVTPFTKIEKCTTSKYKAPRMIQGRDIRFNVEYGRYIKPLEIRLTKKSAYRHNFGKGDYDEIAARIAKLDKKYLYKTEADHKTFDAYVTPEHLKLTHTFYSACYKQLRTIARLGRETHTTLKGRECQVMLTPA
ncbi:unnamed protein product [Colias eurytheme]|nr:unnamed protein product [Colias eurytheme]